MGKQRETAGTTEHARDRPGQSSINIRQLDRLRLVPSVPSRASVGKKGFLFIFLQPDTTPPPPPTSPTPTTPAQGPGSARKKWMREPPAALNTLNWWLAYQSIVYPTLPPRQVAIKTIGSHTKPSVIQSKKPASPVPCPLVPLPLCFGPISTRKLDFSQTSSLSSVSFFSSRNMKVPTTIAVATPPIHRRRLSWLSRCGTM